VGRTRPPFVPAPTVISDPAVEQCIPLITTRHHPAFRPNMGIDIDSRKTPCLDIDIDSLRLPCLPPNGIKPADQYGDGMSACRTKDKKSLIVYPSLYRPQNDRFYEDPDGSCLAWQNQEDVMDQLGWLKKIHEVIGSSEPISHPRVQRSVYIRCEKSLRN
jgi:hypothetical protein